MENFHHTLAWRSTDADAWRSREESTVFLIQEENLSEKILSRFSISLIFCNTLSWYYKFKSVTVWPSACKVLQSPCAVVSDGTKALWESDCISFHCSWPSAVWQWNATSGTFILHPISTTSHPLLLEAPTPPYRWASWSQTQQQG